MFIKKETGFKISPEVTFQDYDTAFKNHEEYQKLDQKTKEYFYSYFTDKAKAK